ncbi:hypothetical protein [Butyrivibrio sp. MC2013]|uniref:hypothetical protein n=1 Tax=Butyrivibrio sp. MC2013 TaxID=1280686 RepID=UPI0003FDBC1F|nr:hypothetical protein [Butyrivibrio sp. MC2013]
MSVNSINTATDNLQTAYLSPEVTAKEKSQKESDAKKDVSAVYDRSDKQAESNAAPAKRTYRPDSALVQQLKADQAAQQQNLLNIVNKMLNKQVTAFGRANSGTEGATDMWKFLASGDFEVDAETKKQAQEDISENGYWGVKQTSERILDFANALTGGDPAQIEKMRDAFLKGYRKAADTWGGELPEISKQTYEAVLKGFDKMAEEAGVSLSEVK